MRLACKFPNGTTTVAAHYRSHEESWPGGFHRDLDKDKEAPAQNPLPPATLELRDFPVNGHRVNYDGSLAVAFRLDARGTLVAFGGHNGRRILIDGRDHEYADKPVALAAWAPVLPERRVHRGAIMELWAQDEAEFRVPLPEGVSRGRLFNNGPRPGSVGDPVASTCESGLLRFKSHSGGQRHLFFVPD
jgi:hypothetical protein